MARYVVVAERRTGARCLVPTPEDPRGVPSTVRHRRRLPTVPHGFAVAGRVSVSSVPACRGVSRRARDAAAVPGVSLPGLGHRGDCYASDARTPARLVLGRLSGDDAHAGVLRVPAPTAAGPGAL